MPDITKYSLDLSQAAIFCIVFIVTAVLVGLGRVEADKLQYLLLLLVPSPIKNKEETPS